MFDKRIYFISGFDPRGSRFYHRLFREEAKKSEVLSGAKIITGKRKVLDNNVTHWQVDSVWNGKAYKVDYCFMTWDDVMKHYWVNNVFKLIWKSLPFYLSHFKTGVFSKFKCASKGPFYFSIYPMMVSLASILLLGLLTMLGFNMALAFTQSPWFAAGLSLLLVYFFVKGALKFGESNGAWWVLQSYVFHARWGQNPLPEVALKTEAFAQRIIQDQLDSPVDEIILVGHCTGVLLVVEVMAKLLTLNHESLKSKLSVLTLGQSIPFLSYIPLAQDFRVKLEKFANNQHYSWFDVGARADPLCFQLVNPAKAEGVVLHSDEVPCQYMLRPYRMFSAEKYQAMQKNKLRIHFQYLMSADISTEYDYFEIATAAPGAIQKFKIIKT